MKKLNYIDLFAGAGGLSEGFIRQGFNPIAHVEMDVAACNTLLTRTVFHHLKGTDDLGQYEKYIKGNGLKRKDLHDLLPEKKRKSVICAAINNDTNSEIFSKIDKLKGKRTIDLIVGGPPCQAYSLAGRSRDKNKMKDDPRNYLFKQYATYLEYYQPKYFVFENVLGLLSAKDKNGVRYFDEMCALFESVGYVTEHRLLEVKDFGVLQNRKRVVLIGKKGGEKGFYPEFKTWNPQVTVSEIFKDLPKLRAGEGVFNETKYKKYKGTYLYESHIKNGLDFTTQHIARPNTEQDKEIYRIAVEKLYKGERLNYADLPQRLITHKNTKHFGDRFKVVDGNSHAAQTIVAHIAKDGHYYIHPDIKQNRSITPREAARLQTFPDDYFFEGMSDKPSRTAAFKQIGNAVPPLMAERIAEEIFKIVK